MGTDDGLDQMVAMGMANTGQIRMLSKIQIVEVGHGLAVLSEGKERIKVNSVFLT